MFLVHLALLHAATCLDMEVVGDVAIDVRISNVEKGQQTWFRQGWANGNQEKNELVFKMMQVRNNVTVAPEVECVYQYPEKEQVNAMLSNMMNELTKVFVRANDFITGLETRRKSHDKGESKQKKEGKGHVKEEGKAKEKGYLLGGDDSRFRVVDQKHKKFFEPIYANMTEEYRHFYNATVERVDRAGRDPCQHQDEVKQIWRDLLDHSLATLKKASHRCVEEYLREQQVEPKSKVRGRLSQYLARELAKARSGQLDMLCDTYQLCYNELL